MDPDLKTEVPIIDSHVHVYPASEITSLAWCSPDNPLCSQHSVQEYVAATSSVPSFRGFIFVETDRRHDLESGIADGSGWKYPLMEVDWLMRIVNGTPRVGEGHGEMHKDLVIAIVPWAPLPSGVAALERYVDLVRERAGESFGKIRGWRYLVQNKARGTMLRDDFVEGLKWLGRKGWTFDIGVDYHRGGDWQLDETIKMIERVHKDVQEAEKVTFVLDHLGKPDLAHCTEAGAVKGLRFATWRDAIVKISKFEKTYVKLSGCFSEITKGNGNSDAMSIFEALQPWFIVLLTAFGPSRIMFGSDWPVCTVGVENAWEKWRWIVQRMCKLEMMSKADEIMLWGGTAVKAYGIKELLQ